MPRVICAFLKQHEQANISLVVQSSTEVVDQVVGQRCDLGLIAEPYAFPGPRGERLLRSPLVCALPAGHRLQAKALLVPADLEGGEAGQMILRFILSTLNVRFWPRLCKNVLSAET